MEEKRRQRVALPAKHSGNMPVLDTTLKIQYYESQGKDIVGKMQSSVPYSPLFKKAKPVICNHI